MLENLFLMLVGIGVLVTIYAKMEEDFLYSVIGAIVWLLILLNALYIQVPFSDGDDVYVAIGFSSFCLIFIFVNVINTLFCLSFWLDTRKMP